MDTSNNKLELTEHEMLTLWHRMTEIYGHRWESSYGAATRDHIDKSGERAYLLGSGLKTWRKVLRGITRDELGNGIQKCISAGEGWPPTAPVFRQWCRPRLEPYQRAEFQPRSLPVLIDPEHGRAALKDIKKTLGIGQ